MKEDWKSVLNVIWMNCRESTYWPEVYEQHDEEDREYFMQLDEKKEAFNARNT